MRKKWIGVLAVVLVVALTWIGTVYAQEEPDYPVETETEAPADPGLPTETDVPGYPVDPELPTEPQPPNEPVEPSGTAEPGDFPSDSAEATTPPPDPLLGSPVCEGTRIHPVLDGLSTRFNIAYAELIGYYCHTRLGVGEIALALTTVQQAGGSVDLAAVFSQRLDENLGWGEIWQSLGLVGNGKGNDDLEKNRDRNTHQDQIRNEGGNDQIRNQSEYAEQKGNPLVTPPGQEGRDDAADGGGKDDNGAGNDPGANPGHSGDKPGNGPKP